MLEFEPTSRTVPTTRTRITARITAYFCHILTVVSLFASQAPNAPQAANSPASV